jgi:hypothetical protein
MVHFNCRLCPGFDQLQTSGWTSIFLFFLRCDPRRFCVPDVRPTASDTQLIALTAGL